MEELDYVKRSEWWRRYYAHAAARRGTPKLLREASEAAIPPPSKAASSPFPIPALQFILRASKNVEQRRMYLVSSNHRTVFHVLENRC
jgi:hypothetical protein